MSLWVVPHSHSGFYHEKIKRSMQGKFAELHVRQPGVASGAESIDGCVKYCAPALLA